jgi:hypothetical protein
VIQQGFQRGGGGGGGGGTTTPSQGIPAIDKYGFTATAQPRAGTQPKGTVIVEPDSLPAEGGEEPQRDFITPVAEQQQLTPEQQQAKQNVDQLNSLPPQERASAAKNYGVTEYDNTKYDLVKAEEFSGLNKIHPNILGFLVPKEPTQFEVTKARLGPSGLTEESEIQKDPIRESFFRTATNPAEKGSKQNLEESLSVMNDKTMTGLFKKFNNNIYDMRAATSEIPANGQVEYVTTTPDGDDVSITGSQYRAISILSGLAPAAAFNAGGTPALFKKEEPQAGAAAPSGEVTERFPVRQTGAQMQAGMPAAQPPTAAPAAPQFSADNPFAKQVRPEQAAPTGRTFEANRARGLATRQATAKRELESVSAQIKDIENMKVGRRNAIAAEKATRWEELNAEKKRLEGILAQ